MLIVALFLFWIVLSQKFDALHLGMGLFCSIAIGLLSRRLFRLPLAISQIPILPDKPIRWGQLFTYLPWLFWQIVLSNLHVAIVVMNPRMPIQPRMIRVRAKLPHALAQTTLANSITLTPGTITVDVDDKGFMVHSLTGASASGLIPQDAQGEMPKKIAEIFGGKVD